MTPERWATVQELFATASGLDAGERETFLDGACGQDAELRGEVDSLLASLRSAESGFLESPAIDALPSLSPGSASEARPLARGVRLGPYEILSPLGAGGMGAVYLASDSRLGREVAVKVLPREFSADTASVRRFQKEARSASALNHPNIVTVYDVGSSEGTAWIAMERVDGQTLRERIQRGPIAVKALLPIAAQVAEGLSKAHEAGIVHRDLKPENVMVTKEGLVKILDFGLAKPASGRAPGAATETFTRPGLVVGTAGYMSPEQARGDAVDFRSDQFSLGAILYEMATGRRAFRRDNAVDTLSAILHDDPPPIPADAPPIPAPLLWIIERCLSKEPHRRYTATDDLARDLSTLRDRVSEVSRGGGPTARQGSAPGRFSRWTRIFTLVVGVVVAAAAILWWRRPETPPRGEIKVRQITSNPPENPVQSGGISPDGNYLAYADRQGMHIRSISTDETRAVALPEGIRSEDVDWEIGPWLPNSTRFFVNRRRVGEYAGDFGSLVSNIWSVSVLGGPPRRLRDEAEVYGVSPDGSQVVFGTHWGTYGNREVWSVDPSGGNPRKLLESDENSAVVYFTWMRPGRRWCYMRGEKAGMTFLSRLAGGGPESTIWSAAEMLHIDDIASLPGNRILYEVSETTAIAPTCDYWITQIDEKTGKPVGKARKVTNGVGTCSEYTSVTADGNRAAFLRLQRTGIPFVADLEPGGTRISNDRRFPLSSTTDFPVEWTPDGKAVFVVSSRTGTTALYRHSLDGKEVEQVAPPAPGLGDVHVTPDGKWILYLQDAHPGAPNSEREVIRVPMSGGPPESVFVARPGSLLLTTRSADLPNVISEPTDDGKMVVSAFDPMKGRGRELLRWDFDPGKPAWNEISPDGTRLAAIRAPQGPIRIYSLRGDPPRDIQLKDWHHVGGGCWTPDGNGLYASSGIKGGYVLLHVDLEGNAKVVLTDHGGFPGTYCVPSRDGRHIAFIRSSVEGNIWMMEGF